jgi:hypothetical protein
MTRKPRRASSLLRRACLGAALVAAAALAGCASRPAAAPGTGSATPAALEPGRWERTVQLVHRRARGASGNLFVSAVERAADEVVRVALGEEYPFDAWGRLAAGPGEPVVAVHPRRGPLADAVARRLGLASGRNGPVAVRESAEGAGAGRATVLVWRPDWTAGGLRPPLAGEVEASLVLVDLLDPAVGEGVWRADTVVAAPGPAEARVVARYILEARFTGRLADASALAAREGLTFEEGGWRRLALAD